MSSRVLPDFELLMPKDLGEGLQLLSRHGSDVAIMAGGTDVLVMMKANYRSPYVMSLAGIGGLDHLDWAPETGLRVGALTTVDQIEQSGAVKQHYRALWQAATLFATPQIRNSATVIGNLLRASPAGDCSCAVLALGGTVVLESVDGRREVAIDDFWLDYNLTARRPDEIAVELRLPPPGKGTGSAFRRLTRTHEDLAKLNASARLDVDGKICRTARLAMGCVGPTTQRLPKCEAILVGKAIDEALLKTLDDVIQSEIAPIDDKRSTAEYRRAVAGVLLRRTISQALAD